MGWLFYLGKDGSVKALKDGLSYPNGIAMHKGKLYISEHLAGRIMKFKLGGPGQIGDGELFAKTPVPDAQKKWVRAITGPDGVEISPGGTVYVSHYGAGEVLVYSSDGKLLKRLKTIPQFVTNMAISPDRGLIITGAKNLDSPLQEGVVYGASNEKR